MRSNGGCYEKEKHTLAGLRKLSIAMTGLVTQKNAIIRWVSGPKLIGGIMIDFIASHGIAFGAGACVLWCVLCWAEPPRRKAPRELSNKDVITAMQIARDKSRRENIK